MKNFITILFACAALFSSSQIQKNNKSELTIEQIMQAPEKWIGTSPEQINWNIYNEKIYFNWNPEQDTLATMHAYSLKAKSIEPVSVEEKRLLPGRGAKYNTDKSKMVYTRNGNIVLLDIKKKKETLLTSWTGRASSVDFALNDTHISFLKDKNLFTINLENGVIKQWTNFTDQGERPASKPDIQSKWLEAQQLELFAVLRERAAENKAHENQRKKEEEKELEKIVLGGASLAGASLSPGGKFVIYNTYKSASGGKPTSVTHHVTESGYTEDRRARTKVGAPQTAVEMGIFDVTQNKTVKINTDQIPGLKDLPDYLKDYPERMPKDSTELKSRDINLIG